MTMTQSAIAEELDAYEDAMWFTSSYLIATSSLAPMAGRLAAIFSPRGLVLPVGCFFAVGGLVTSQAHSFAELVLGRVLTGLGGAGIMTLSVVLVLELVSRRRRGLFIGLVNAGFTVGLSFGAVVYGAALPATGWVSPPDRKVPARIARPMLTLAGSDFCLPSRPHWRLSLPLACSLAYRRRSLPTQLQTKDPPPKSY